MAALEGFGSGLNMSQQRQNMALADSQEARTAEAFATQQERGATEWDWAQQDRGMMLEDRQRALAAEEAERQKALEWQTDAQGLLAKAEDGTLSAMDFAEIRLKYPEQSDGLKEVFDGMSQDRRHNEALDISRGLTALKTGQPEVALALLDERIQEAENADDRMGADQYRTIKSLIEMDPAAGQVQLGLMLTEADPDMAKVVLGTDSAGSKVQSTEILPDGTVISVVDKGGIPETVVRNAMGEIVTGQAAADAIRAARAFATEAKAADAAATAGGRLATEAELADEAAKAKARGTAEGKAAGEDTALYESMDSKMAGLELVVEELNRVADQATYTATGKLVDAGMRELGMEPRDAAVARAKYIAMVDNQVLPMLRDTFGAAFTVAEGQTLRATLGDADKSPAEKKEVLKAFIEQKKRDLKALGQRTGAASDSGSAQSATDDIDALLLEADGL